MNSLHLSHFIGFFKDSSNFTITDIVNFYRMLDKNVSMQAIHWRIHLLTSRGIIHRISKGIFTMSAGKKFRPESNSFSAEIRSLLKKKFPLNQVLVWDNSFLSVIIPELKPTKITVIESVKDIVRDIHFLLRDHGYHSLLKPKKNTFNDILEIIKNPVVVFPIITEAPLGKYRNNIFPLPEKIIPDLFVYPFITGSSSGNRISEIYSAFQQCHTFNTKSMFRYAARRNKSYEIHHLQSLLK